MFVYPWEIFFLNCKNTCNPSTANFNLGILCLIIWIGFIKMEIAYSSNHLIMWLWHMNKVCQSFKHIPKSTKLHLWHGNPTCSFILAHLEHYLIPNHSSTRKEATIISWKNVCMCKIYYYKVLSCSTLPVES